MVYISLPANTRWPNNNTNQRTHTHRHTHTHTHTTTHTQNTHTYNNRTIKEKKIFIQKHALENFRPSLVKSNFSGFHYPHFQTSGHPPNTHTHTHTHTRHTHEATMLMTDSA